MNISDKLKQDILNSSDDKIEQLELISQLLRDLDSDFAEIAVQIQNDMDIEDSERVWKKLKAPATAIVAGEAETNRARSLVIAFLRAAVRSI